MAVNSRLPELLLWSMPVAAFWGYIGFLVAGIIGVAAGATVGGCVGLFTYCLFVMGKDSDETEETGGKRREIPCP